jgi:hypothetical protein
MRCPQKRQDFCLAHGETKDQNKNSARQEKKKLDNELCLFGRQEGESLKHFALDCQHTKQILGKPGIPLSLLNWMKNNSQAKKIISDIKIYVYIWSSRQFNRLCVS